MLRRFAVWPGAEISAAEAGSPRTAVLVSTDIGGTDPDDFQSMVHLLVYADVLDIEGVVSSPFDAGRTKDILEVIDCYEKDYASLKSHSDRYPAPAALRAMTKQGEKEVAPYAGVRRSTEGSEWIVKCARRDDPRPLHVLVWGGIEDLAQALHDAPDILPKLRVYYIGGPNKKWGPNAYQYIATHHPTLWIIEANSTYRGWFVGGNQQGEWGNKEFVTRHVKGHGALGDFFVEQKWTTSRWATRLPSRGCSRAAGRSVQARLGRAVRARLGASLCPASTGSRRRRIAWKSSASSNSRSRLGTDAPEKPEAQLRRRKPVAHRSRGRGQDHAVPLLPERGEGVHASRSAAMCPRSTARLAASPPCHPAPELAQHPSAKFPNWWTDDPSPEFAEGPHHGAKTVSRWREEFLRDFAARMDRCKTPATSELKRPVENHQSPKLHT